MGALKSVDFEIKYTKNFVKEVILSFFRVYVPRPK